MLLFSFKHHLPTTGFSCRTSFWHSSIRKYIVDLCFHCEHAVHFRGCWIRISLSFRFLTTRRMECDCRFLWLSETFSKSFPEVTLDSHLDLKLYEFCIFWILLGILSFSSFAALLQKFKFQTWILNTYRILADVRDLWKWFL